MRRAVVNVTQQAALVETITNNAPDKKLSQLETQLGSTVERANAYTLVLTRLETGQRAFGLQLTKRQVLLDEVRQSVRDVSRDLAGLPQLEASVNEALAQTLRLERAFERAHEAQMFLGSINRNLSGLKEVLANTTAVQMRHTALAEQVAKAQQVQDSHLSRLTKMLDQCPLRPEIETLTRELAQAESAATSRLAEIEARRVQTSLDEMHNRLASLNSSIAALREARDKALDQLMTWLENHTHYQTPDKQPAFKATRPDAVVGPLRKDAVSGDVTETGKSNAVFRVMGGPK